MKHVLAFLGLLTFATSVRADAFYTLVGLKCNPQTDRLIVYYIGAYNEEGEAMIARKNANEWQPGKLILSIKDDKYIGDMETVVRTCELSHGRYEIRIGPVPGNMNIQGRCGAQIDAWVEIKRDGDLVVSQRGFEPDCQYLDGKVLTRITIDSAAAEPRFKTIAGNEFYR